jgi:hypothetical protein
LRSTNADYTFDFETAADFSGGGPSYFETSPFWQSYTGSGTLPVVPSYEIGDRGVPDVAMCGGGFEVAICAASIIVDGASELICRISHLGTGRFPELGTTLKGSPAEP